MEEKRFINLLAMLDKDEFQEAFAESGEMLREEPSTNDDRVRLMIINSYSGAVLGRFDEALNMLKDAEKNGIFLKDIYFLLSFISSVKKDHENVLFYGQKFFEIFEDKKKNDEHEEFIETSGRLFEILNNLGSAAINLGRKDQAIQFFEKGLEANSQYSLIYQNLGIIYLKDGNFEKAEEVLLEGKKQCPMDPQIPKILGILYRDRKFFRTAEGELIRAMSLGAKDANLELGILYFIKGKLNTAESMLNEFLEDFPGDPAGVEILNKVKSHPWYGKPDPTISAAMIVKNEEEMLSKCLESIQDLVDEIIIVDTGSEDRTVEIAESFGAKVFHHPWKNNFSEARNHSLDHATMEWILIIDGDEEFEREDSEKVFAYTMQDDFDAVCFSIYSALPGQIGGVNTGKHYSPRLFKRREDIRYEGIVHNLLTMPPNTTMTDIRVYHYGYNLREDKMQQKYNRSIKLLLKQVEEMPDDPFVRFNTAQMYLSRNFIDEAEEHALKVPEILKPDDKRQQHIYLMTLYQLTIINLRRGDTEKAKEWTLKALDVKDDYIDQVLSLGVIYYLEKNYDESEKYLNKFLEQVEKLHKEEYYDSMILNKLGSDYEAYAILGDIYLVKGDLKKSREYFNKAVGSNEFYWISYHGLAKLSTAENDVQSAMEYYENAIKYGYLNVERYGTLGTQGEQYKKMIDDYKNLILKEIDKSADNKKLKSAFDRLDDILKE